MVKPTFEEIDESLKKINREVAFGNTGNAIEEITNLRLRVRS